MQPDIAGLQPGLIVTLFLVRTFAPILSARPGIALLILAGDAARWILATMTVSSNTLGLFPSTGSILPALIWTSVYALLCWDLAWYAERQTTAPAAG